jgi:hypothetical protein
MLGSFFMGAFAASSTLDLETEKVRGSRTGGLEKQ